MILPNFLIIGCFKCGTTSLWRSLRAHPDIFMPSSKELYYFSDDTIYKRGLDWYANHFKRGGACPAVGEATDRYTCTEKAPERISRVLPEAKLLYIVRNPIKQIESHYLHLKSAGKELCEFNDAVLNNPDYIKIADYKKWVDLYNDFYMRRNIKIIFLEDLIDQPINVINDTLSFLNLKPLNEEKLKVEDLHKNKSADKFEDRSLTYFLRKNIPLAKKIDHQLNGKIRYFLKYLLRRKIDSRPSWNSSTKDYVLSALRGNIQAFLKETGKPADFWKS